MSLNKKFIFSFSTNKKIVKLLHMQQEKIFNKKVQQLELYPHFIE